MSTTAAILRRSRIVQSLTYGCLLGIFCVVPAIVVRIAGEVPQAEKTADELALIGSVPAALAGAITWFFIVVLRRHTAPTRSGVCACWFGTVIGSYALVPIWIGAVAVWRRCSFGEGPSLDQCWETFSGMVVLTAMISWWGLIFSAPVVLPILFIVAWLWVRRLHPRIAGTQAVPVSG